MLQMIRLTKNIRATSFRPRLISMASNKRLFQAPTTDTETSPENIKLDELHTKISELESSLGKEAKRRGTDQKIHLGVVGVIVAIGNIYIYIYIYIYIHRNCGNQTKQ